MFTEYVVTFQKYTLRSTTKREGVSQSSKNSQNKQLHEFLKEDTGKSVTTATLSPFVASSLNRKVEKNHSSKLIILWHGRDKVDKCYQSEKAKEKNFKKWGIKETYYTEHMHKSTSLGAWERMIHFGGKG